MDVHNSDFYFLSGGGEMGERIRATDWGKTSLGEPAQWPSSLKTMVSVMLENPFGMYIAWGQDYIQIYNDGYRPILGANKHPQALGISTRQTFAEIWHIIGPMFGGVMGGKAVGFPDFMLPLDRNGFIEECFFDFSYSPIRKDNGEVGGVLVTVLETTNKKKAEDALKVSEEKFRTMADNIPNLAWMANADGWIYWYNKKWYEYTGTTPEEMEGWGWQKVHDPHQLPVVMERWKQSIEHCGPFEMIFPIKGADSTYRQFLTRVLPQKNSNGEITQWFGTNTDITDQKKVEEALKESEARFRTMAEGTNILIAVGDEKGNAVFFNKAYQTLTGRANEKLLTDGWEDLLHPDDRERFINEYMSAFSKRINFTSELRLRNQSGNYRQLLLEASPRFSPDGSFAGFISSCVDVSDLKKAEEKLRESDKRFRNTVRQAPIGITILRGNDYHVEMANDAYLAVVDKKEEDFVGKPLFESLPEVKETVEQLLKDVMLTGIPFNGIEYPVPINRYGKQEISYFNFVYHPLKEKEEEITGIIVTVADVSASVKAKHFVAESEKQFRKMIMDSPIPMAIFTGEDFIIQMGNRIMFEKIWRRKESEIVGKKLLDVFPELKEQKYLGILKQVYTTGETWREAESLAHVMGENGLQSFYLDYEFSPILDPSGAVSGLMITVNDVTDKVNTRKKIEDSEQRFRSIAESLPYLIWETDQLGNSIFMSAKWKEYAGFIPRDMETWKQILHPEEFESNTNKWIHSLKTGELYRDEVRLKNKHGNYRWHAVTGEPVFSPEGEIIKWIGALVDIHIQKSFSDELEKQVESRTIEIEKTNKLLTQKNEELEKMNSELQSFAYISSHDLQEPLRKIQTFSSQLLIKEYNNLSDNGKDKFQRMQNAAKRMQALIDDLLAYSRTSTAERKFELTPIENIIELVKEDLKEELQQNNGVIKSEANDKINIIPFQFRQLLYNLISNSIKFSKIGEAPHIFIKTETGEGASFNTARLQPSVMYHHISLSDNGIGFEPRYQEKIFEVFQRLHGKSEYNGTGIGLAIVKKIVENHLGVITATSELGNGATFDIYLPIN